MMIALLIAGVAAILGGILTIVYGILLEFSLGNSLLVTGTIALCSGLILCGLYVVAAELKVIARRLGAEAGAGAGLRVRPVLPPAVVGGEVAAVESAAPVPPPAPPWQGEAAPRERARPEPPPVQQPVELPEAAAPKPRRNLLFASSSRRERERARAAEPAAPEERLAPPAAPAPPPAEPAPATFEDAWPKPERSRPGELPAQRRARPSPSTFGEGAPPAAERPAEAPLPEAPPAVTVLKSGVVDGMAYSLYSDGSIEAQMPEGMMRFASIDELRAHLDQRG